MAAFDVNELRRLGVEQRVRLLELLRDSVADDGPGAFEVRDAADETSALFAAALALPADERTRLIESLAASLADDVCPEWRPEVERRRDDIESGRVAPVSWTDVRDRLRRP